MNELTPPDSHYLLAAQGWLELGDHLEADKELDEITPELRVHPDVLEIRWQIYAKEKKWLACVDIGHAIINGDPHRASGWLNHSSALHHLQRTSEAYTHLAAVADDFPENWHVPFDLACYCSRLGRMDEAEKWLKMAFAHNDPNTKFTALDDPELLPLFKSQS